MKKKNLIQPMSKTFIVALLFLVTKITLAQTLNPPVFTSYPTCGTTDTMMNFVAKTEVLNCTNSSAAYTSKYCRQDFYIPNKATEPDITIKITFHIINNTLGTISPWPGTAGINALTQAASYLDYYYSSGMYQTRSANYSAAMSCNYPNSNDPKISFELTNVYQYYDNAMNTSPSGQAIGSYINSIDPNRMTEGFPIFINSAAFAHAGQLSGYNGRPAIHTVVNYNNNDAWFLGVHLKHEFGHAFGLFHTYRNGGSESDFGINCSHPDFLCDVFPQNNTASGPCPNNNCTPSGGVPTYYSWNMGCGVLPDDAANGSCGCNALSSNNLMGGTGSAWISELQQGRIHRNLHLPFNQVRFFVKEMASDAANPWLIASNEIWDFDIQMYNDIVVKPGATLTIKCKVGMANSGRIIVERGARLIIDGGEVFPWGRNWNGIQVWGTSNKRQSIALNGMSIDHGIVNIVNQGIIREASEGITTGKFDIAGNIDWGGYSGGIIRCDNAQFINCWRGIQYLAYHNFIPANGNRIDNIGYINNTTFETNSIRKNPTDPYPNAFITLWEVDGVKFYGNSYKNTVIPMPAIQNKGMGIYSIDASYYIDRYKVCSTYGTNGCAAYSTNNPSTFTNLNYGIYISNALPASRVKINDNDFVDCNRAVYFGGTSNTSVTNNRINVGTGFSSQQYLPYGIYSNYSSGYDVSNNTIKSTNGTYNTNLATGICINGSNAVTNRLYRNTMNNVNVGTTIYGDNQGLNQGDGLSILCNSYGQGAVGLNQNDIQMGEIYFVNGKIDIMQGSPTLGANNLFSHNATPLTNCIKNDFLDKGAGCYPSSNLANTFNYFFNPAPANLTEPLYYSTSLVVNAPNPAAFSSNMCPVVFGGNSGGGGGPFLKSVAAAKKTIAATTASINISLAKIDGGNTKNLLNAIKSQSAANLKNLLESKNPYLSDTVLMAYFAKTNIPPADIVEMHDKNKPVSQDVWQVILNRNLPNGIMNQLKSQQSVPTINELVKLYAQVGDLKQKKGFVIDETIRQLMTDSLNGWSMDSIIDLMAADNRYLANQKLLAAYISFDKLTKASILLNTIKNDGNGVLNDFCQLQALILNLKQQNKNIIDIKKDGAFRKSLEQMASNTNNAASVNAEAMLKFVFNTNYYEYLSLPNADGNNRRMINNSDIVSEVTQSASLFKLYPNPANQSVTVQFVTEQVYSGMQLMVYDITGKVVITQTVKDNLATISINNLTSGMYLVTMVADGKVIGKQKLIKE